MTEPLRDPALAHATLTKRDVAKSVGWLVGARLSTMLVSFATMAVVARILTPADFGVIVLVLMISNLASTIVEGGIAVPLVQRPGVTNDHVAMALLLATLVAVALLGGFAALIWMTAGLFGHASISSLILISLLALPFRLWAGVFTAVLQRQSRFRSITVVTLLSSTLGNALPALGLAWLGYGVWALIVAFMVMTVLECVALAYAARPVGMRWPRMIVARDFAGAGGAGTIMQVVNWAALNSTNSIVVFAFGITGLGLFSRGGALISLVKDLLGSSLSRALLPAFSGLHDDPVRQRRAFEQSLAIGLPLFAVVSAAVAIHADPIVLLALGPGWTQTAAILQILALGLLPRVSYKIAETLVVARGGYWAAAARQVAYLALLGGCVSLGTLAGLTGVAAGVVIATTLYYILSLAAAARVCGSTGRTLMTLHGRALAWAAVIGAADVAALSFTRPLGFWPAHIAAGAGAVTVATVLLIWGPSLLLGTDLDRIRRSLRTSLGGGRRVTHVPAAASKT